MRATYSPEDNKIRIYPDARLDTDEYNQAKAAGFKWAPKQELFVAPMWTPGREDFARKLCGEIEDEDTSLVERQEERAGRFENYSDKRASEAESAHNHVQSICEGIPLGQPILVGHHSERHARKHAQQIESGMRKAVSLWETSSYWTQRAAGALHHAKYKELPTVRARRIKKIEADRRTAIKESEHAEVMLKYWRGLHDPEVLKRKDGAPVSAETKALLIAGHMRSLFCFKFPLDKYPREKPASQYEGDMSPYSALTEGVTDADTLAALIIPCYERGTSRRARWIQHYNNRLAYEKAMLGEAGALDLIAPKKRPTQLPLLNYRAPEGIQVENMYYRGEFSIYPQVEMTKEEYAKATRYTDWKTLTIDRTHRVRAYFGNHTRSVVLITDSKEHPRPDGIEKARPEIIPEPRPMTNHTPYIAPERTKFDDMKDSLKGGIKTVSAPQLFPTPPEIARKMVEYADMESGMCVLEPSAGTGNIIQAVLDEYDTEAVGVEINWELCAGLRSKFPDHKLQVLCEDFMECSLEYKYPRIIMNPPFQNGDDIKHIKHALTFLASGGRLVALCVNGPRQERELQPLADHWEVLPAGSFKNQGTGVNVALLVITA